MIFGTGAAAFTHGWWEEWMVIAAITPGHHHELEAGETRRIVIDVYGEALGDVYSTWMEYEGQINPGQVLSAGDTDLKLLYGFSTQEAGKWQLVLQDPVAREQAAFDILGDAVSKEEIAEAVWQYVLGTETEGMAGHTLDTLKAHVDSEHGVTREYTLEQRQALEAILDDIKGFGYDKGVASLKVARETMDRIFSRLRQQNTGMQHNITRGFVADQLKRGR